VAQRVREAEEGGAAEASPSRSNSSTCRSCGNEAVPNYVTWWDVPVAEVAKVKGVREARLEYDRAVRRRCRTL
jgi:TPP-dependent trihydroxycyclohexane-1,2-dione (THcHDO) dehydratase